MESSSHENYFSLHNYETNFYIHIYNKNYTRSPLLKEARFKATQKWPVTCNTHHPLYQNVNKLLNEIKNMYK